MNKRFCIPLINLPKLAYSFNNGNILTAYRYPNPERTEPT